MKFRKLFAALLCSTALLLAWFLPATSTGQTYADDSQLTTALLEISAQQKLISENQAKIDAKIAEIQEQLRIARIYVSRSGGTKK